MVGLGRNDCGEKNRIDRNPRTVRRLPEPNAPAEEGVLGQSGFGAAGLGGGQCSSSSAAAINARARR
jgi:hypothetical protein